MEPNPIHQTSLRLVSTGLIGTLNQMDQFKNEHIQRIFNRKTVNLSLTRQVVMILCVRKWHVSEKYAILI